MYINRYPTNWSEDLNQHISAIRERAPHANIYALIEGVHHASIYRVLKKASSLPFYPLYANSPGADEETLALSPIIVEYREDSHHTWSDLLSMTDGLPALSIIATPETLSELVERLSPWCVVDADGYTLALSFADTRVLPELHQVLDPAQRASFYGPAIQWHYVARDANWAALPLPEEHLPPLDEVILNDRQCARLMEAAEADHILYQLRTSDESLVGRHTPARAHALVSFALACAGRAHMDAAAERRTLCSLALKHPECDIIERMQTWLSNAVPPVSPEALRQQFEATPVV